jgi:hypothetical protein
MAVAIHTYKTKVSDTQQNRMCQIENSPFVLDLGLTFLCFAPGVLYYYNNDHHTCITPHFLYLYLISFMLCVGVIVSTFVVRKR